MGLNRIDAKIRIKRSTTAGEIPVLGPTNDYTDGSWSDTSMIYPGEFFMNMADERLWIGGTSGVTEIDMLTSGGTDYDFCSTGIITGAISGCTNDSIVVGGVFNLTSGSYSFVGGGQSNSATKRNSSVVGGLLNLASGGNSFVGGGQSNSAILNNSAVIGGQSNLVSGSYSVVVGGSGNTISGARSAIIGGQSIIGSANDTVYVPNLNIQGGKSIKSSNSGSQIDLDYGGQAGDILISSDNGLFLENYFYSSPLYGTYIQDLKNTNEDSLITLNGSSIELGVRKNLGGSSQYYGGINIGTTSFNSFDSNSLGTGLVGVIINSINSTIASAVTNSVVIGGTGLSANTSDTAYVPNLNVNDQIFTSSIIAADDDANAITSGVTSGQLYQTTGAGAAPLNAAGILMIKQ